MLQFQNWLMIKLVPSFKLKTKHLYNSKSNCSATLDGGGGDGHSCLHSQSFSHPLLLVGCNSDDDDFLGFWGDTLKYVCKI